MLESITKTPTDTSNGPSGEKQQMKYLLQKMLVLSFLQCVADTMEMIANQLEW